MKPVKSKNSKQPLNIVLIILLCAALIVCYFLLRDSMEKKRVMEKSYSYVLVHSFEDIEFNMTKYGDAFDEIAETADMDRFKSWLYDLRYACYYDILNINEIARYYPEDIDNWNMIALEGLFGSIYDTCENGSADSDAISDVRRILSCWRDCKISLLVSDFNKGYKNISFDDDKYGIKTFTDEVEKIYEKYTS